MQSPPPAKNQSSCLTNLTLNVAAQIEESSGTLRRIDTDKALQAACCVLRKRAQLPHNIVKNFKQLRFGTQCRRSVKHLQPGALGKHPLAITDEVFDRAHDKLNMRAQLSRDRRSDRSDNHKNRFESLLRTRCQQLSKKSPPSQTPRWPASISNARTSTTNGIIPSLQRTIHTKQVFPDRALGST